MKISNNKKKENTKHIYSSFLLNFTHIPNNYMFKNNTYSKLKNETHIKHLQMDILKFTK